MCKEASPRERTKLYAATLYLAGKLLHKDLGFCYCLE